MIANAPRNGTIVGPPTASSDSEVTRLPQFAQRRRNPAGPVPGDDRIGRGGQRHPEPSPAVGLVGSIEQPHVALRDGQRLGEHPAQVGTIVSEPVDSAPA